MLYNSSHTYTSPDVPKLKTALLAAKDPYTPFLNLITESSNPEDPTPILSASVFTTLASFALVDGKASKSPILKKEALPKAYTYLATLAKTSDSGLQDIAVQFDSKLLRTKSSREIFWSKKSDTVAPLVEVLSSAAGVALNGDSASTLWGGSSVRGSDQVGGGVGLQLLYHILLVIWQLSFEGSKFGDGLEQ